MKFDHLLTVLSKSTISENDAYDMHRDGLVILEGEPEARAQFGRAVAVHVTGRNGHVNKNLFNFAALVNEKNQGDPTKLARFQEVLALSGSAADELARDEFESGVREGLRRALNQEIAVAYASGYAAGRGSTPTRGAEELRVTLEVPPRAIQVQAILPPRQARALTVTDSEGNVSSVVVEADPGAA